MQTWQTEIGAYIQQNPTKVVFMAFGVGCLKSQAVEIRASCPAGTLATNWPRLMSEGSKNQAKHPGISNSI